MVLLVGGWRSRRNGRGETVERPRDGTSHFHIMKFDFIMSNSIA